MDCPWDEEDAKMLPRYAKIGLLGKILGSLVFFHCDQVHI